MATTFAPLGLNSRGDSVRKLQEALNTAGYNLNVDGVFGTKTQDAVRRYQTANGMAVSGSVDEAMWNTLTGAPGNTTPEAPATTTSASILAQLQQALQNPAYTPKTPEQIRQQAEGEYQSYYDQLRLTAQQQQAQSDLALQQQREGLQDTYDKQREDSAKQYRQAYSQTDRAMLGRGMQRSSYTAQTLANLLQEGAEAQQDIGDAQAAAEGNIDAQRAQLAQQRAQQLGQYDAAQQADILARIRELEDQEYNRGQQGQQNQQDLLLQIWQALYQSERDQVADNQWNMQFNASQSSGGGGSRGSGGSSGTSDGTSNGGAADKNSKASSGATTWERLFPALNSSGSGSGSGSGSRHLNPLQREYVNSGLTLQGRWPKK